MSKQSHAIKKREERPPCDRECQKHKHPHHSPEHLLSEFFRRPPIPLMMHPEEDKWLEPDIEISETPKEIVIAAELPGMNSDDIQVNISQDGYITISGEKQNHRDESDEKTGAYFSEFSYGTMQRTIPLPPDLEYDAATASFENGVLSVHVPKTAEATQKVKKVPVQKK